MSDQWMIEFNKMVHKPKGNKWLRNQLKDLDGQTDSLSLQRWKLLMEKEEIKEIYEKMLNQRTWGESYQLFLDFVKTNHRVPSTKDEDKKLSNWSHRVLQQLKHDLPLSNDIKIHIARKNNLMLIPEVKSYLNNPEIFPNERWEYKFNLLKKFIEKYQRLPSESRSSPTDEYKLAHWLVVQIQAMRGRTRWNTSEQRKNLLMDIPLVQERCISMKKIRK